MTRRNWDGEPKKQQTPIKALLPKLGRVPLAMELRIRRLGWAKRVTEQLQEDDLPQQQVLAVIFGQTRLDKFTCMTSHGELTFHCHFMG